MSEQFRSDVRTLCKARDSKIFHDLPLSAQAPLFRILDKMGAPSGYTPPPKPVTDGFMIGGEKI
jgi:hypothetical protein